jgi:propanol-preferring alcohol dehydrogenase
MHKIGPVEERPLKIEDLPIPEPKDGEVLIRIAVCGVCRTDLHVVEGELPLSRPGIIPGHQVVGQIVSAGPGAARFKPGARVGVAWLHRTCQECEQCLSGRENLCERAVFTGYTAQGGFAEYLTAPEDFVYPIPEGFADIHAAPLLCAGIIGFRCLRMADVKRGDNLGIYGFGAAGHVSIQVARHMGCKVFVCTRDERHRTLAAELGAEWVGEAYATPPQRLNAAIIFAPAGELVPTALAALKRGGTLVLGGIHMSAIPSLDYGLLYYERAIRSVANNTRKDGEEFLRVAAELPIVTSVEEFRLEDVNEALVRLKNDAVRGAAVIRVQT